MNSQVMPLGQELSLENYRWILPAMTVVTVTGVEGSGISLLIIFVRLTLLAMGTGVI